MSEIVPVLGAHIRAYVLGVKLLIFRQLAEIETPRNINFFVLCVDFQAVTKNLKFYAKICTFFSCKCAKCFIFRELCVLCFS